MKPIKNLILLALLLALTTPASQAAIKAWRCSLPGGAYMVRLSYIVSVSQHQYLVDGTMRVYEVTIATTSQTEARFYYIEPGVGTGPGGYIDNAVKQVQDAAETLAGTAGVNPVWKDVVKNYPTTTHAHTVEFRLETLEQLNSLYKSAAEAFNNDKDGEFKIGGGTVTAPNGGGQPTPAPNSSGNPATPGSP